MNVPVFVTGKDLPGFGEKAWCVSRGGAFDSASAEEDVSEKTKKSAAFVPATAARRRSLACPPPQFPGGAPPGSFSPPPARLEIVPAAAAVAGAPMGGAFYAKSSVELDVEAHGEAAPGAAGAMAVGGGGGGGGARARRALLLTVPEEGGATVFVRPGGARVAPSGCDFGTIAGVAARHAHAHAEERPPGGEEETWGPLGVPPRRTREKRRMVRVRFAGDARARRAVPTRARRFPADRGATPTTSGTSWFEGSTGDSKTNARSIALSSMTRRNRAMCAAARRAGRDSPLPAATTYHGGSPASVRRWAPPPAAASESHFSASSPRTPPRGSRRGASSCAWVPCSPRPRVRCETPPPFEWAPPRRPPDVARGAVEAASAAEAFRDVPDDEKRKRVDAAVFARVAPPALEPAAPRSGPAEGGVLVSLFGSGLNGGARPAAWFGAVGPVACRVAGARDAASDAAGKNETFRFFVAAVGALVRADAAHGRRDGAPLAASATGDAQTRSAFGFGVTYAALHTGTRGVSGLKTSPGDVLSRRGHGTAAAAKRRETPETRVVVAPAAAPVGGGAVLWLYGSGFRNGVTEPPRFEPPRASRSSRLDEGDDGRYGDELLPAARVGACVPVSSALAACEAPSLAASTRRARARARFVPFAEGTIVEGFVEGVALGSTALPLAVAAPTSVSGRARRRCPPAAARRCSRGGPPRRRAAHLGCVFGSVGPAAGRFAAEARDTLFVRRARARAQPVRVARSPNFSARGGDRRISRAPRSRGRTRALFPATPPAWRTSAATRRTAPLGRRAPSSFPPRWRRTRPRTCASSARARTSARAAAGAGAYRDDKLTDRVRNRNPRRVRVRRVSRRRRRRARRRRGFRRFVRFRFRRFDTTRVPRRVGHAGNERRRSRSRNREPSSKRLLRAVRAAHLCAPARLRRVPRRDHRVRRRRRVRDGLGLSRRSRRFGDRLRRVGLVFGGIGIPKRRSYHNARGRGQLRAGTRRDARLFRGGRRRGDGRRRARASPPVSGFPGLVSRVRVRRRSETSRRTRVPNSGPTTTRPRPARVRRRHERRTTTTTRGRFSSPAADRSRTAPTASRVIPRRSRRSRRRAARLSRSPATLCAAPSAISARASSGPWDPSRPSAARPARSARRRRRARGACCRSRSWRARGKPPVREAPAGRAASVALDAAGSGAAVTAVAVGGAGAAEGALLGGSGGSGAMVYGWGLDALEAVDHQHVYASAHTHVSQAPAPVARARARRRRVRFRFRNRRERQKRRGTIEYPNTRASDFRFRVLRR